MKKRVHDASENDRKCDGFTDSVAVHLRVSDRGREKGARATSVSSDLLHEKHAQLEKTKQNRMAVYHLTKKKKAEEIFTHHFSIVAISSNSNKLISTAISLPLAWFSFNIKDAVMKTREMFYIKNIF